MAAVLVACQGPATERVPAAQQTATSKSAAGTVQAARTPGSTSSAETALAACPTPPPDQSAVFLEQSVTAEDAGKTLVIHRTDRFSVFLDDGIYPVQDLRTDPTGILGVVSNGSLRGPGCFPIMFEAVTEGKATITDRGFTVRVVVDDSAAVTQFPMH